MSEQSLAIIRRAYDAFRAGDLDGVVELLHPDVVWDATGAYAHRGAFFGPYEVHNYLRTLADAWEGYRLEAEQFGPSFRSRYLVTGKFRGVERSSGKELEAPFIHVLRLRRGKIAHVEIFVDRDRAMEAMHSETTAA